jgi:hypothetical protein
MNFILLLNKTPQMSSSVYDLYAILENCKNDIHNLDNIQFDYQLSSELFTLQMCIVNIKNMIGYNYNIDLNDIPMYTNNILCNFDVNSPPVISPIIIPTPIINKSPFTPDLFDNSNFIINISDTDSEVDTKQKQKQKHKKLIKKFDTKTYHIHIYENNMKLKHLVNEDPTMFIRNLTDFNKIKFYYKKTNELYKYHKNEHIYFIANNNMLYVYDNINKILIPAIDNNKIQAWKNWIPNKDKLIELDKFKKNPILV